MFSLLTWFPVKNGRARKENAGKQTNEIPSPVVIRSNYLNSFEEKKCLSKSGNVFG
jgi:hypothetical protein